MEIKYAYEMTRKAEEVRKDIMQNYGYKASYIENVLSIY